jgi:D-alanine-D-alanine ligase
MAGFKMTSKTSLALIFGGRSGEHEVSLMSARSVRSVLSGDKYSVTEIGITREGQWLTGSNALEAFETNDLSSLKPVILLPEPQKQSLFIRNGDNLEPLPPIDVYFPVTHGTFGEDGTLQGLFEMADVAYVGCGVLASSVGMDKNLFKDVMRANRIPVVESVLINRSELTSNMGSLIERIEKSLTYPLFVKPVNLGSSVGITKCRTRSDLFEGLMEASQYDRRILVERGVDAREIEVSVLGNDDVIASVPGEVRPSDDFYTYDAKYIDDNSELIIPAKLSDEEVAACKDLAIRAFKAIDGAGMGRIDFLMDRKTHDLFVSEINTIPGFTKISMYPKLMQEVGIPYDALVDKLVDLALQRKSDRDHTQHTYRRGA